MKLHSSSYTRAARLSLFAAVGLLLSALRLAAADDFVARVYTNALGRTLLYRLLTPKDYDPAQKYPLVFFLHGAGERGADNVAQLKHGASLFLKPEMRDQFPCFVFAPQCPPNQRWVDMRWEGNSGTQPKETSTPMQLSLDVIDTLPAEFSIDPQRLYVTGLSMGGYGTWDCITRFPGRFAAAVPICGGGDERSVTADVAKTPVWAFHSSDDPTVNVVRTRHMIGALLAAGGHPHYFEYWGLGHDSWDRAYAEPELLPWMFAQRRGQPDTYDLKTPIPVPPRIANFPEDATFPGEGPIRKADWFRNLWIQRRTEWWRHRFQDHGAVVFLGDSITQGWGSLAKDFPDLKVANRGISGDITRGVLYRLNDDVLDLDPAAVVLLIGTNDLEDNGEPDQIAANVNLILAACQAAHPKMPVIVCKLTPSSETKNRPADKIRQINALVDKIVSTYPQCIRCDTWKIFANDQGDAKPQEFPDLLHPNAAGYAKFADALRPIFAKLDLEK
jgi:lysophospholipase L1-like esterase/poly(3-hydroxybutyrate) depolymerase